MNLKKFDNDIFSIRLKHLRTLRGLTLEQLANEFSSYKGTVSSLENSKKNPSLYMIINLADYFDVSVDYLIGRTNDPSSHKD